VPPHHEALPPGGFIKLVEFVAPSPDFADGVGIPADLTTFALEVGAPGAYDYGPERNSWLTHHLTNWMGDDGFLRKASCKIRRHNPEGDMLFIKGRVKRKFIEDGKHLVEIEQEAHNQEDELSVLGSGVVELPSRGYVAGERRIFLSLA
jgi:hypothetical protein